MVAEKPEEREERREERKFKSPNVFLNPLPFLFPLFFHLRHARNMDVRQREPIGERPQERLDEAPLAPAPSVLSRRYLPIRVCMPSAPAQEQPL
jgi:hypothetical protein